MHRTDPRVFLVAETSINDSGLGDYLRHIGAKDWTSDAISDIEELIEVMGRSCYRSFGTDLNPNITKVREGNRDYLANILKTKHGSVLEHASVSFMFCDVSRVFTHELVRHRAGVAISQESLRFVRLTDLGFSVPTVIRENETAMELFLEAIEGQEMMQSTLASVLITDEMPFSQKKIITSALRRIAPMGLSTNIGWTANIRTIRWLLDLRTHPSAEEEIRVVFMKVGEIMQDRYPDLFFDFKKVYDHDDDAFGMYHWKPEYEKV